MSDLLSVDLGTGTVIGLVSRVRSGRATVVGRAMAEQPPGAVREGRIVDCDQAARALSDVIQTLDQEVGLDTSRAHYAISSRRLQEQTVSATVEQEPGPFDETGEAELRAKREVELPDGYFLVDEQRVELHVDDTPVERLQGQYGRQARATWRIQALPRADLESRLEVLRTAGLMPGSLVLEPTAAARAAFPARDLGLELLLLDFGAGTLDATCLDHGVLRGVATVEGSGDELTETLQDQYGLDFKQAQSCKHRLGSGNDIEATDWKGETVRVPRDRALGKLTDRIRTQLERLQDRCGDWDPDQVALAGGGAQFPFLPRLVARTFGVEETNIVHQAPHVRPPLDDPDERITRASDYTVVGVTQSVMNDQARELLQFTVNGRGKVLAIQEPPTLEELARQLGYNPTEDPPGGVMVQVDGETYTERPADQAQIQYRRDGEPADGAETLRSGDHVRITPADPEVDPPVIRAEDVLPDGQLTVKWQGKTFRQAPELVDQNGQRYRSTDELPDGARLTSRTSFSRETIIGRLQEHVGGLPGELLTRRNGRFTAEDEFSVGQTIELVPGVDPSSVGLGTLQTVEPADQPVDRELS